MMVKGAKGGTHNSSITLIANVSKVHQQLIRDHLVVGALGRISRGRRKGEVLLVPEDLTKTVVSYYYNSSELLLVPEGLTTTVVSYYYDSSELLLVPGDLTKQ